MQTATKADKPAGDPLIAKGRSIRILAKSLFRELQGQGYDEKQIVSLATELISEVTHKMAAAPTLAAVAKTHA